MSACAMRRLNVDMAANPLLQIENLGITFQEKRASLPAVRNFNFHVPACAITCLVGESGCGKSLTCRAVLRLTPPNAVLTGNIFFKDENILSLPEKALRKIRGARIGMIFQEPMTALNPVLTIGKQAAEPLRIHLGMGKAEAKEKVIELFASVGIPSPASRYGDYPHQLSGGMRQRVMIAMALACKPDLLLADEPTTALDATIQGQILRLIVNESRQRQMAVLLITHDLGVVAEVADNVGVMYAGLLVEHASCEDLFANPLHPYTQGLLASAPSRESFRLEKLPAIPGTVPALSQMPSGCPFHPRCSKMLPICKIELPPSQITANGHMVCCWLHGGQHLCEQ